LRTRAKSSDREDEKMAMRAQFFEYTTATNAVGTIAVMQTQLGRIQFTKATEFIVVEDIGSTPGSPSMGTSAMDTLAVDTAVQIKINTTEYFLNPDGSQSFGIPGRASPYPRSNNFYQTFFLDPEVYVLPGQNWEILLRNGSVNTTTLLKQCFVKYVLYDGTDAVIANKLLEMGVSVKPANIDWYKRMLIENKTKGGGA
jgi:hypothetical protein